MPRDVLVLDCGAETKMCCLQYSRAMTLGWMAGMCRAASSQQRQPRQRQQVQLSRRQLRIWQLQQQLQTSRLQL